MASRLMGTGMHNIARQSDKPAYWDEAVAALVERDRILRRIIPQYEGDWLATPQEPFVTLARALIGQQSSAKAADAAWKRFTAGCGGKPTPSKVLRLAAEDPTLAALPKRKADYITDLATHFAEKKVRPARWGEMDDEAVVAELCAIRGIGRWTAEMFLIFHLQRSDVLPLDDSRLIKAISLHYFSGEPVSRFEAREVAQAWAPWRTVATWFLWRSLDPAAAQY
ncbi:DNA-3-methyladenine glycosylase 2 family protein [Achromobacter sp. F4_2707]|uniref:DNA-3-methyladenine glycosylase family protein n=1 Tax=Achromobacter sp. F4_2707 TaxID=3114286 RepID=UPI0039C72D24